MAKVKAKMPIKEKAKVKAREKENPSHQDLTAPRKFVNSGSNRASARMETIAPSGTLRLA